MIEVSNLAKATSVSTILYNAQGLSSLDDVLDTQSPSRGRVNLWLILNEMDKSREGAIRAHSNTEPKPLIFSSHLDAAVERCSLKRDE